MWFSRSFKSHVSPHELIQEISNRSNRAFRLFAQGDAFEFLTWLLNTLHFDLNGSRKKNSSVIYKSFQGVIKTISLQLPGKNTAESEIGLRNIDDKSSSVESPFLALGLDLPPPPLFRKEEDTLIPQVPLVTLLKKYNGVTTTEIKGISKTYEILELPKYLILHIKRFIKSDFMLDKNPTIVNFSVDNVAFGDLINQVENQTNGVKQDQKSGRLYNLIANIVFESNSLPNENNDSSSNLQSSSTSNSKPKKTYIGSQKNVPITTNIPLALAKPKQNLPGEAKASNRPFSIKQGTDSISNTKVDQDLIAQAASSSVTVLPINGQYSIHLRDKASNQWFKISDLHVEPIIPQMICLSESYIQVWEKQN
ncbi:hypothetical protein BB560_000543 [Smittium megazygosporum]|uniref:USP domain-containing protein n=1 Tax=Smittium megazygosporum TaxID=133381 RepID=A0A2T9ZK64_9FUNG|nr:hypothetical protein BB560_000543 [Smittium megazygosporum]